MRTSKESSGVRTCTAPSVSSQPRLTASSAAAAASGAAVPRDEGADLRQVAPFAEQEDHAPGLARLEADADLERRAGIEPGAEAAGERLVPERRRPGQRAVAAEEGGAIAGGRAEAVAGVGEGHPPRELVVPGVGGEDGAGGRVALGHDVLLLPGLRRSQHPLGVAEDGEAPGQGALVGQRQQRELHRVHGVHEDVEGAADAVHRPREAGHPGPVADHEPAAPLVPRQRPRGGRPRLAAAVVADQDGLGGRVGDRIVGEGREPVLAAVPGPGEGRPRGRDHRPEGRAGDDVGPGQGRLLVSLEDDDVLASAVGEAAEPVGERQRRHLGRGHGRRRRARSGGERQREGDGSGATGSGRSSCWARVPPLPLSTARATPQRRTRSASPIRSPRSR